MVYNCNGEITWASKYPATNLTMGKMFSAVGLDATAAAATAVLVPSAVPLFAPTSADLPCATFMGAYGHDLAALNGQLISPQKNQ